MDEGDKGAMDGGRERLGEQGQQGIPRSKSRKGFGYRIGQARARPSNTPIRDLLSYERYGGCTGVLGSNEDRGSKGRSYLLVNVVGLGSP